MIRNFLYTLAAVATMASCASTKQSTAGYDQKLAESLGADEYGMRSYQFVILKTGPVKISDKDSVSNLFRGHLENINRLVEQDKLIVAGPFGKNDHQFRGLFIFKTKDKPETEALLATDPAIKAGLLAADIYPWYGSAALPMYLPFSKKIAKKNP